MEQSENGPRRRKSAREVADWVMGGFIDRGTGSVLLSVTESKRKVWGRVTKYASPQHASLAYGLF